MNIPGLKEAAGKLISDNASTILTAGGVIGTVLTATLAARAGGNAALRIDIENRERQAIARANDPDDIPDETLTKMEKIKIAAPLFIPPVAIGVLTITSIVAANQISAKRAAALAAAYGLSEQRWADYKQRVEEKLSKPKKEAVEEEIAQDRVNVNPPPQNIIVVASGEVLCYDMHSDRYFHGSAEKILSAKNAINEELWQSQYASLSLWYDQLGLKPTGFSEEVGWNMATTGALDVVITTVKSPDDKPCLAVEFVTNPRTEYRQLY